MIQRKDTNKKNMMKKILACNPNLKEIWKARRKELLNEDHPDYDDIQEEFSQTRQEYAELQRYEQILELQYEHNIKRIIVDNCVD
jgi:hypothetical protein